MLLHTFQIFASFIEESLAEAICF